MDTKQLRQKILDLAIRGKLVPQDPNDEPASVLLERIKAEKERMIKEGKIKKSKKSAKTSDTPHYQQDVPFEVPEGWVWCIVDDFAYVASGSTPSKDSFVDKGVPYIKMYNLRNQKIDFDFHPQYIKREIHEGKLQRSKTEVGDLIMNIVGPPLGKLAIIPPSLPESNFNQAAVLIRPYYHKEILVKYLFYYLSEMSEINSISTKGTAGQVNISLTQSQNMRIALPPLEEQKRIISKIDELFKFIEMLDDNATNLEEAINKAKSKILDLAIHGKLVPQDPNDEPASELLRRINPDFTSCDNGHYPFDVPSSWVWTKLPELCTIPITDGTHQTPTYTDKEHGIPFISSKDVTSRKINWNNVKYITKELHEELHKRIAPQKDDILLAKNGTTGVAAIVEDSRIFDIYVTLAVIRPSQNISPHYLLQVINSRFCKEQFNSHLTGIGLPNLHLVDIKKTIIPVPPIAEQQRIVQKIEELFSFLDNIQKALEA